LRVRALAVPWDPESRAGFGRRWGNSMAYGSLRFVDMVEQNFLFRGSSPVMSGYGQYCFDYDGLKQAMKSAPDLPRSLPDPFYLMVISLLHSDEWQEIDTEVQFFGGSTQTQFGSTKNTSFLG
jgi:hypothetical protein